MLRKTFRIGSRARIVVDASLEIAKSMPLQDCHESNMDRGDVSMSTHFGNEAPTRLQHAVYLPHHGILVAHPVQSRIGKYRIESLISEWQILRFRVFRFEGSLSSRRHHLHRSVYTQDLSSGFSDPSRQLPVPAT